MFRKISLILFLAIGLGGFLVLRPYIFGRKEFPSIQDRLPDAHFLGHAKLLSLAKEVSGMLYFYKVPYREFLSEEFILAQAKTYGLQVQNTSYLFANDDASWGVIIELTDSSKVSAGIQKLKHSFAIKDTLISSKRVYVFKNVQGYLHYDENYIMYYQGNNPTKYIHRVATASVNQISPNWRSFLNEKKYNSMHLAIYSNWSKLKDATINYAIAYPEIDSTHVSLFSNLRSKDTLPFSLKLSGKNFTTGNFTSKLVNIHVNQSRLKRNTNHPLYKYLVAQGKKIGFPTHDFLQAWEGDLSFSQGGLFAGKEKYIESELDEDFNITEVIKTRNIKVPGFALLYSTNENGASFFTKLLNKGVLTEQEGNYYFLLSPPLKLKKNKDQHLFYSSYSQPKMEKDSVSHVNWTYRGTEFKFVIDSIKTFEFFGKLSFPMNKILESNNLIQ